MHMSNQDLVVVATTMKYFIVMNLVVTRCFSLEAVEINIFGENIKQTTGCRVDISADDRMFAAVSH